MSVRVESLRCPSWAAVAFVTLMCETAACAITRDQAGIYLSTRFGLSTTTSETVSSVATGSTLENRVGFFGGPNNQWEAVMRNESEATTFTYAETPQSSQMDTTVQDFILRGYWGPAYFGVVWTTTQATADFYGVDLFEVTATGLGANLGFGWSIGRSSRFFVDIIQALPAVTTDALAGAAGVTTTQLGSRLEVQLGALTPLARGWLDLLIGYGQRTQALTVAGNTSSEVRSSTLLGLNLYHSW